MSHITTSFPEQGDIPQFSGLNEREHLDAAFFQGQALALNVQPSMMGVPRPEGVDQEDLDFSMELLFDEEASFSPVILPGDTSGFEPSDIAGAASVEPVVAGKVERLELLFEGVNRMGALGTLYWEDARERPAQNTGSTNAFPGSVSGLPSNGHGFSNQFSDRPGSTDVLAMGVGNGPGEEHGASSTQGSDERWDISGTLRQFAMPGGEIVSGLMASPGGRDIFEGKNFDVEAFVKNNTELEGWTKNGNNFAGLCREVVIAPDADAARIDIAWAMLTQTHGTRESLADITVALLFKVRPDGELVPVAHELLQFPESAFEDAASAFGTVSWPVESGERYLTALLVMESCQSEAPGTVLAVNNVVCVYEEPQGTGEQPFESVFPLADAALLLGDVFDADVQGSDALWGLDTYLSAGVATTPVPFPLPLAEGGGEEAYAGATVHFEDFALASGGLAELLQPVDFEFPCPGVSACPDGLLRFDENMYEGGNREFRTESLWGDISYGSGLTEGMEQTLLRMLLTETS